MEGDPTPRTRRRLTYAPAAPLILLAVAIAAVVGRASSGGRTTVAASGPTSSAPPPTFVVPPPQTSVPTTTAVTSTVPTTAATTRPAATVPPEDSPTTTAPVTVTTSPASADNPPGPVCQASFFAGGVTLDKPSYRPGERVTATATFRDVSGQTCYFTSTQFGITVLDSAGATVAPGAVAIGDYFRWAPSAAGESHSTTQAWDQRLCRSNDPCGPAPPGTYTAVVSLQPFGSARAAFQLVAG